MKRPEALDMHPPHHRALRRADGELLGRRARALGHRLRAGAGVEPADRLRHDERPRSRRTVVEDDHVRPDDPRAVRAHVPLQPARPPRRRPRLLAERPRRRAVARPSPCCRRSRPAGGPAPASTSTSPRWRPARTSSVRRCSTYLTNGREAHPVGNADPFGEWCPNEVYRCGDQREVAVTCRDDDDWTRLCAAVSWDIGDLAGDPRYATAAGRIAGAPRSTPGCAAGAPAAPPTRRPRRCRRTGCPPAWSRTAAT